MPLRRSATVVVLLIWLLLLSLQPPSGVHSAGNLSACAEFAFSTEEEFVTQGPVPADGNPVISDGDLLGPNHTVCARNQELLAKWQIAPDLGLDAVDVLDVERNLVAFSTELDDPQGRFGAGDLLATNGMVIPNVALLTLFQVGRDLGLDAVHFVGAPARIVAFLEEGADQAPDDWLGGALVESLNRYDVDLWFSTEGTELSASTVPILDGTLLSARTGAVVLDQPALFAATVPAGIPARGVDFGLDAVAAPRVGDATTVRFSTEILYRGEPPFTDGDVLRAGGGVEIPHADLITPFEPLARFLGIDALFMRFEKVGDLYLPIILLQSQE